MFAENFELSISIKYTSYFVFKLYNLFLIFNFPEEKLKQETRLGTFLQRDLIATHIRKVS